MYMRWFDDLTTTLNKVWLSSRNIWSRVLYFSLNNSQFWQFLILKQKNTYPLLLRYCWNHKEIENPVWNTDDDWNELSDEATIENGRQTLFVLSLSQRLLFLSKKYEFVDSLLERSTPKSLTISQGSITSRFNCSRRFIFCKTVPYGHVWSQYNIELMFEHRELSWNLLSHKDS